jgi:hypothetical protein
MKMMLHQVSLNQTTKEKNQKFINTSETPDEILADPSIINLIRQTPIRLTCKEVKLIQGQQ